MSDGGRDFVLVAEDRASALTTATIIDRVIAGCSIEWLRELWEPEQREAQRRWRGLSNDGSPHEIQGIGSFTKKGNVKRSRKVTTLAPGRKGRAVEVAKFFLALDEGQEQPALAAFACDLDGEADTHARAEWSDRTTRLAGRATVYVLALAQPEFEAWFVAGFFCQNAIEEERHRALCKALGEDPCEAPHALHSKSNGPRDAKVVLEALCGSSRPEDERVRACVESTPLEDLVSRGKSAGISLLIEQLTDEHLSRL